MTAPGGTNRVAFDFWNNGVNRLALSFNGSLVDSVGHGIAFLNIHLNLERVDGSTLHVLRPGFVLLVEDNLNDFSLFVSEFLSVREPGN